MTELDRTLELYRAISSRIPRAITNSATFQDGYPTGGGSSGSGSGDRTGTLATKHAERDTHGDLRRELERCIEKLANLTDRLAPSNKAQDHLATQASDACPPGCCESCFRDAGHRSPARTEGSRMCLWCEKTSRGLNMPMLPLMLVQRHNRGLRISERDIKAATGGRS